MSNPAIEQKIKQLTKELKEHNYRYYTLAEPIISDFDFDMKLKELEALEKEYPQFADPNSPTQKVGGGINTEFVTVKHKRPMLSLGNTYNEGELKEFDARVQKLLGTRDYSYSCELKIDGLAISITYINGKLEKAVTRGNGVEGDDVTQNVKTIRSLAKNLQGNFPAELEVRGEIFMHRKAFERLNTERESRGEQLYANPRNVAAGSLKLLDSNEVAKRPLDIYLYHAISDQANFESHFEALENTKSWGLKVSEFSEKCVNIEEVLAFIEKWDAKRKDLSFDIDGVVIKVNRFGHQEELGFTAKIPRWAISYKYKTEAALTQLLSVDFQVGRTGALTPVANLQPVFLLGTTVKRASLHNANEMERLDIHHKDWVYVEKGGEIIPKVTHVELSKREANAQPVTMLESCPECSTPLVRKEGEANHYCPNEYSCPPQVVGKIQHFISRKAMNIDGLGEETVELLFKENLLRHAADLYTLSYNQVIGLERMAEKSATNLLKGIEDSKQIPFARVLFGLGIRFVGETVAKKLAQHFKNIDNLAAATLEELCNVDEIGERIAGSIIEFFEQESNRKVISDLKEAGVQLQVSEAENQAPISDVLKGKNFVISGVFSKFSRDELKNLVEANGGKNVSSISSKTDYVLAGENMGPAKLEKAQSLGIAIISEEDFEGMIGGQNPPIAEAQSTLF